MIQGTPGQRVQEPPDLLAAQDHRQAHRCAGTRHLLDRADVVPQHLAIQKKQPAERLVLRRSTDPLTDGQPLQKRRDLRRAHRGRMPLLVKDDVSPNPVDIRLFCPVEVMVDRIACLTRSISFCGLPVG
jgi:hypothetical protein